MTARPLVAVEQPPLFAAHQRSWHYVVYDTTRNRAVASVQHRDYHPTRGPHWFWSITIPPRRGAPKPEATGQAASLTEALAAVRAAWDVFPDLANWPLAGGWPWPANRPPHYRGDDVAPGQGPWLPGREPPGWRSEVVTFSD